MQSGYVMILRPEHPNSNACGYIAEHRLVVEKHLGRTLKSMESVHHINRKKDDNRIQNLIAFKNHSKHKIWQTSQLEVLTYEMLDADISFDGRKVPNV